MARDNVAADEGALTARESSTAASPGCHAIPADTRLATCHKRKREDRESAKIAKEPRCLLSPRTNLPGA